MGFNSRLSGMLVMAFFCASILIVIAIITSYNPVGNQDRTQDIAKWSLNVAENARPSKERDAFGLLVKDVIEDGVITDAEYRLVRDSYNNLLIASDIESIGNNILKIRAV